MSELFYVGENSSQQLQQQQQHPQIQSNQITKFKNRNRIEIAASLLSIARAGALKTHLMYRANLSYLMVSEYLNYLISAGLIEEKFDEDKATKLFHTTPKGLKFLEVYESLQEIAGVAINKKGLETSSSSGIFSWEKRANCKRSDGVEGCSFRPLASLFLSPWFFLPHCAFRLSSTIPRYSIFHRAPHFCVFIQHPPPNSILSLWTRHFYHFVDFEYWFSHHTSIISFDDSWHPVQRIVKPKETSWVLSYWSSQQKDNPTPSPQSLRPRQSASLIQRISLFFRGNVKLGTSKRPLHGIDFLDVVVFECRVHGRYEREVTRSCKDDMTCPACDREYQGTILSPIPC